MSSRRLWLVFGIFSFCIASYSSENLFGPDQRKPVTSTTYPWSTIGFLSTACTGTLVGRDLVLTAAHCVIDPATRKLRANLTAFYPNYIAGSAKTTAGIKWVWWGTTDSDHQRASDWAIIQLTTPEGDRYGWMGVEDNVSVTYLTLAGYSFDYDGGRTATAHLGCAIRQHLWGLLLHDCHNTRGASGGPMFAMKGNMAYLYALNVAEYRNGGEESLRIPAYAKDYANIALPATTFLAKLKELKGQ